MFFPRHHRTQSLMSSEEYTRRSRWTCPSRHPRMCGSVCALDRLKPSAFDHGDGGESLTYWGWRCRYVKTGGWHKAQKQTDTYAVLSELESHAVHQFMEPIADQVQNQASHALSWAIQPLPPDLLPGRTKPMRGQRWLLMSCPKQPILRPNVLFLCSMPMQGTLCHFWMRDERCITWRDSILICRCTNLQSCQPPNLSSCFVILASSCSAATLRGPNPRSPATMLFVAWGKMAALCRPSCMLDHDGKP